MKNLTASIAILAITLFSANVFAAQTQSEIKAQLKNEVTAQIKNVIAVQLNDSFNAQSFAPKLTLEKVNTQWALAKNTVTQPNTGIKATDLSE